MVDPFFAIDDNDMVALETYLKAGGSTSNTKEAPTNERIDDSDELSNYLPLLSYAVHRNHVDSVYLLLAYGADTEEVSNDGHHYTALHCAQEAISNILLINGAEVNKPNSSGRTALHIAVSYQDLPLVKILLHNGADLNTRCHEGLTPLEEAISYRGKDDVNPDELETLIKYFQKITKENIANVNNYSLAEKTFNDVLPINYNIAENDEVTRKSCENIEDGSISVHTKSATEFEIKKKDLDNQISQLSQERILLLLSHEEKEYEKSLASIKPLRNEIKAHCQKMKEVHQSLELCKRNLRDATEAVIRRKNKIELLKESIDINFFGDRSDYECPVCYEVPFPPAMMYQCEEGHLYCSQCRDKPNMEKCPQCGVSIGDSYVRCRAIEKLIVKLFLNSPS